MRKRQPKKETYDLFDPLVVPLLREIINQVCEKHNIPLADFLTGYRKEKVLMLARQEYFWRARKEVDASFSQIGRAALCERTAVVYGIRHYQKTLAAAEARNAV